jgi:hypothetical protein
MEEILVSSLVQTDALANLLIEKGLTTRQEFMRRISEGRALSNHDDGLAECVCNTEFIENVGIALRHIRNHDASSVNSFPYRLHHAADVVNIVSTFTS